jgi:hypothetical protein
MNEWNKERIVSLLQTNNRAVEKAIVAIYHRQTLDEQSTQETKHANGIGFTGAHARLGTYYARWILEGNCLTGKHLEKARAMSLHYTAQLLQEIFNKSR